MCPQQTSKSDLQSSFHLAISNIGPSYDGLVDPIITIRLLHCITVAKIKQFNEFCFHFRFAFAGTMIPKSGGDYAYLSEAFSPMLAFLYMWSAFIVIMPTGNAVTAITFAQYLLQPLYSGCVPPNEAVRLLAAAVISKQTIG